MLLGSKGFEIHKRPVLWLTVFSAIHMAIQCHCESMRLDNFQSESADDAVFVCLMMSLLFFVVHYISGNQMIRLISLLGQEETPPCLKTKPLEP